MVDWSRRFVRLKCRVFEHYTGVYTTDIGGFYYCVNCGEVLGHYYISPERRKAMDDFWKGMI